MLFLCFFLFILHCLFSKNWQQLPPPSACPRPFYFFLLPHKKTRRVAFFFILIFCRANKLTPWTPPLKKGRSAGRAEGRCNMHTFNARQKAAPLRLNTQPPNKTPARDQPRRRARRKPRASKPPPHRPIRNVAPFVFALSQQPCSVDTHTHPRGLFFNARPFASR